MRSRIALVVAWVGLLGFGVPVGRSAAEEPYKIGYLHSYSGYLANMGTVSRDGFVLAVAEINKRGGVNGRQITVVQENDESDPSKGVPAAIRLISGEKVLAMALAPDAIGWSTPRPRGRGSSRRSRGDRP